MTQSIFKPRVSASKLKTLTPHYPAEYDHEIESVLAPMVRKRGYFTKPEFESICRWKTPRSQRKVASNSAEYIEAVTRTALSTESEQLRIEVLTLLNGVSWPTASVILHFCHRDAYPILDIRALWTLGVEASHVTYNFDLWWGNTQKFAVRWRHKQGYPCESWIGRHGNTQRKINNSPHTRTSVATRQSNNL